MAEEGGIEYFYRYEDVVYAPYPDEDGERRGPGHLCVELRKYRVHSYTRCGVWLCGLFEGPDAGRWKFVNTNARKQFACTTVELAKESFIARKQKQASIYEARARCARDAIHIIEKGKYAL